MNKLGCKVKSRRWLRPVGIDNREGFHDLVIYGFQVRTPRITAGQTATVDFVAEKSGTFEYYCSVGSHRQMGMRGNPMVE